MTAFVTCSQTYTPTNIIDNVEKGIKKAERDGGLQHAPATEYALIFTCRTKHPLQNSRQSNQIWNIEISSKNKRDSGQLRSIHGRMTRAKEG